MILFDIFDRLSLANSVVVVVVFFLTFQSNMAISRISKKIDCQQLNFGKLKIPDYSDPTFY